MNASGAVCSTSVRAWFISSRPLAPSWLNSQAKAAGRQGGGTATATAAATPVVVPAPTATTTHGSITLPDDLDDVFSGALSLTDGGAAAAAAADAKGAGTVRQLALIFLQSVRTQYLRALSGCEALCIRQLRPSTVPYTSPD